MEDYKEIFIDFLLKKEALKIGEFKLKSGRMSPYFINTGMFDDGFGIRELGNSYADKIADKFKPEEFDIIFGPAYKGIPLAVATAISLSRDFGINKGYAFNRKEPKGHGEATKEDRQKNWLVGSEIKEGSKILMLDDVVTTGGTKYEAINLLNSVADYLKYPGLVIAVDRQEVGGTEKSQLSAVEEFQRNTGIAVEPIVTISEIMEHLWGNRKITEDNRRRLESYLIEYGTEEAKRRL